MKSSNRVFPAIVIIAFAVSFAAMTACRTTATETPPSEDVLPVAEGDGSDRQTVEIELGGSGIPEETVIGLDGQTTETEAPLHPYFAVLDQRPGEYAVYLVNEGDQPYYLGICNFGSRRFLVEKIDATTREKSLALVTMGWDGRTTTPEDFLPLMGTTIEQVRPLVVLLLNIGAQRLRVENMDWRGDRLEDLVVGGRNFTNTYRSWVPVFNLYSVADGDTGETLYSLVGLGVLRSNNDPAFFDFTQAAAAAGPDYRLAESARTGRIAPSGVALNLDANWVEDEQVPYVIRSETPTDAILFADYYDPAQRGAIFTEDFVHVYFVSVVMPVVPSSVGIVEENGGLILSCVVYESEVGAYRRLVKSWRPIPGEEGQFTLLTLFTYEDLYQANQAYFDRLLAGE